MSTHAAAERRAHLRILTFEPTLPEHTIVAPETVACTGEYGCDCPPCTTRRAERVVRGIQPRRGDPFRHVRKRAA